MNTPTIADALVELSPGASFVARAIGTEDEWVEWLDTEQDQPTDAETEDMLAQLAAEYPWVAVREQRNRMLRDSDWTDLPHSPLGESQQEEWQAYRQALRDVPQQDVEPDAVVWPDKPEE